MKSNSQCGQDIFAHAMIGDSGTFLDIGCNHPVEKNNTYALEQLGWTGLLVDNDEHCISLCREQRTSPVIQADVTAPDWTYKLAAHYSYISLDVDAATLPALRHLLNRGVTFDAMTLEHDGYRFGTEPRDEMRKILKREGYCLICADVKDQDMEFEDWWIGMAMPLASKCRFKGCDWKEIIEKLK